MPVGQHPDGIWTETEARSHFRVMLLGINITPLSLVDPVMRALKRYEIREQLAYVIAL